jgi:hypothetical protein
MAKPSTTPSSSEQHIRLDEDWSVDYWKTTLGVEREELIAAVRKVGDEPQAVAAYLAARSASGPSS